MPGGMDSPGMRYAGLGIELAAAVGLLSLLGWWLDGRWGTEPWGLMTGALVGLVGGMFLLVRTALGSVGADGRDGGGREGR